MQQLDYWFNKHPDGFYKFLEPCDSTFYQDGDSWTEEIGISKDEFRTSFDRIGIRYGSKKQFDEALERFKRLAKDDEGNEYLQEVYYCSYHDKFKGLTFYFRNHSLVDQVLDEVVKAQPQRSTEVGKSNLRKSGKPTYVSRETQSTEVGKSNPDITETTSETTTERTEGAHTGIANAVNDSFDLAVSVFQEIYKCAPHLDGQTEMEAENITDLPVWRETVRDARANKTEWRRIGTMLKMYRERIERKREDEARRAQWKSNKASPVAFNDNIPDPAAAAQLTAYLKENGLMH